MKTYLSAIVLGIVLAVSCNVSQHSTRIDPCEADYYITFISPDSILVQDKNVVLGVISPDSLTSFIIQDNL